MVLLGDESYLKSIDDIYPKNYREEWPIIAPNQYHFNDNNVVEPKPDDGSFPPDMTGDYTVNLHYINGTLAMNFNGNEVPYPGIDRTIAFTISNQSNSISDFVFKINNREYQVDNAYIYGTINPADSTKAEFSVCFEYSEVYGEYQDAAMSVTYGWIIMGGFENRVINNVKCWFFIKDKYPAEETNYSFIVGGQQFYVGEN